jgi:threonine/homoserine/homoserine lactone efflux protein
MPEATAMSGPIPIETWLVFSSAVLVLNVTPGPDVLFVTATGLSRGPRAGVMAALGVSAGSTLHVIAAALGLAALLVAVPTLLGAVRLVGAAYLIWLGIQVIRQPFTAALPQIGSTSLAAAFRGGVVSTVLNPKRALFVFAFLPQFVTAGEAPAFEQIALLGATMILLELPFNAAYGASGGRLGRLIAHNARFGKILSWLAGVTFFGLAMRLALARPQN